MSRKRLAGATRKPGAPAFRIIRLGLGVAWPGLVWSLLASAGLVWDPWKEQKTHARNLTLFILQERKQPWPQHQYNDPSYHGFAWDALAWDGNS